MLHNGRNPPSAAGSCSFRFLLQAFPRTCASSSSEAEQKPDRFARL
jgi:hypothetical protein